MELKVESKKRDEVIDITNEIRTLVEKKFNEEDKACLIYTPHTTCAVMIQENYDPDVNSDILEFLEKRLVCEWDFILLLHLINNIIINRILI